MKPQFVIPHILFLFFISTSVRAQCPTGDVKLNSQAEVNNFDVTCTTISGDLTISGSNITDLSPLSNLSAVNGDLKIDDNDSLVNMSGFISLESISGDLFIGYNDALTTLYGLSNVKTIGGYLYIGNNNTLEDIGLSSLTSIGNYLDIISNDGLVEVSGLSELESIGGYLQIGNNRSLTNVDGLSSLESIGQSLNIVDNTGLAGVDGFSALKSIGGFLQIVRNNSLVDVSGFSSLISIGNYLRIENNLILSSLTGLENIDPGSITELKLQNNPLLTYCDLTNICTYLSDPGNPRMISGNSGDCETVAALEEACLPEVVAVSDPEDITVDCPVQYEDLCLPGTVTVTYEDSSTGEVVVNWDGTGFDGSTGTHTLAGELDLRNLATNPDSLTTQIDIIVEDITAPVMTCPESYEVDCDRVVTFDLPQATDECSAVSVLQTDGTSLSSGSVFPPGTTPLTYRAIDASGNASYCSLEVKVLPPLKIKAVSGVAQGDTIHITDCLPPDISKDDLDLGPYRKSSSLRSNVYSVSLPEPRPFGMWKLLEYAYEVTDRCGVMESFKNYVALYDLVPSEFLYFPADTTIASASDLPPVPETVEIVDICRYVVWDTVATTPLLDYDTGDTLAFVRRWMAEDEVGNKSFRDQMIYIRSVPRPDLNGITAHFAKVSDLVGELFPGTAGTNNIPVSLHRIDSSGISTVIDSIASDNWQGSKGNVIFTPLLPGSYQLKIDIPSGYMVLHPDSLVYKDGWSDTLALTGDSTLNLGTILLVPEPVTDTFPTLTEPLEISSDISSLAEDFTLYPNPSTGRVKVGLPKKGPFDYVMFNQFGLKVKKGAVESGSEIDLSGQADGMYFIRVMNGKEFMGMKRILLFTQ